MATQSSGFGATTKWSNPVSFQRKGPAKNKPALTSGEFLKQSCDQMSIGVGPAVMKIAPTASRLSATARTTQQLWLKR